jgi:hypothetical protein
VTERLKRKFPPKAQNWGVARKTVNLFLRDCTYDHHLRAYYGLAVIEPWLEVPLDSYVANTLGKHKRYELPSRWPGVKYLTPEESARYQDVAQRLADHKGIYRVDLDLYWWRMK